MPKITCHLAPNEHHTTVAHGSWTKTSGNLKWQPKIETA